MANLTQIELPSGTVYDLMDQGARDLIAAINNWEYMVCTNAADTPYGVTWDDEGTTITGTLVAADSTMYIIYLVPAQSGTGNIYAEYITIRTGTDPSYTYSWEMMGSTQLPDMSQYMKNKIGHEGGTAGDLAYKDTASGSGTVTVPKTFTTTTTTATTDSQSISVSGTPTGTVSTREVTVEITPKATGTAANVYTPAGTNASSSVSGTCSVTPSGSISVSTSAGTPDYTPAGTIAVSSAGTTTTIANPTSKTVVTDMSVAAPSGTATTGELIYYEVTGTKLSLKKIVETTGDSINTTNTTVKTGDASYGFTGTGVDIDFTGSSSSGTISGTAAAQTFTGTDTYFETASNVVTAASFVGDSMTSTGTVTVPDTFTSTTVTDTTESKTVNVTVS